MALDEKKTTQVVPSVEVEEPLLKRAFTLYAIIAFKLLKGSLFLTLAITVYVLSDNNLPEEFKRLMF